jgi:hypothetical protein
VQKTSQKKANGDIATHCQTVLQESPRCQRSQKNSARGRSSLIAQQGSEHTKHVKHATTARKSVIFAKHCG